MRSTMSGMLDLWMWPLHTVRLMGDATETMLGAQRVVAARLPTIAAAARNPWTADHAELGRMITEKVDAAGLSGRAASSAIAGAQKAANANLAAAARLARGDMLWPTDWMTLAAGNVAAASAMMTMPAAALAPISSRVAANDRRLGRGRHPKG